MTLEQWFDHRREAVARVVARYPVGEVPVDMRGVCESSGYCACRCAGCLGGRHQCPHRRGCHKNCRSV